MDPNTQRAEAERWLGIAAKLLTARDFLGSKTFAIRAREADPNNSVSDQILAVVDTVLAGEKRLDTTQQPDWYAVLQLPRMVRDPDLIANHYRRLALLLSPDRNRLPFSDYALQLAMDAWSVLSDPTKKWLFDNELALSLQRASSEPERVEPVRVEPVPAQVNTFQFFQPQPQVQPTLQMWQQPQPPIRPPQPQPQQHLSQREFMPVAQPQTQPSGMQQVPPQWQMRDPTPTNGGGERNKRADMCWTKSPPALPPTTRPATQVTVAQAMLPPAPAPVATPIPARVSPAPARENPTVATRVVEDGNASNANPSNDSHNNIANNDNAAAGCGANENNEDMESFWTACPYCLYIYEYQKMYQECTLRCQNCKRGFHASQIPNPPPLGPANSGRHEKDKESSFCCWGFFPLGFSMAAWKKHNRFGNPNGSSNWVPFSPMFSNPDENRSGDFQWFASNNGNASVMPKNVGRKSGMGSAPRVYIDDDEDFDEGSDSSDADSSDHDWRTPSTHKKKKHKRGRIRGGKRGRPRKSVDRINQENVNSAVGGGVSVGGEDLEDGSSEQEVVVGLVACTKTDGSKNVASTVMRKQTRRSVKDVGRLDLNVEFNNEGDEHAPTVSAVNGEEDVIENIGFFEGLDEFLSTLPILNVAGDEKAKPS